MEKTIRCPECGEEVVPEFRMCPECSYQFESSDYMMQGLDEEDFLNIKEVKMSENNLMGKIKIIAFIIVIFVIIFQFIKG